MAHRSVAGAHGCAPFACLPACSTETQHTYLVFGVASGAPCLVVLWCCRRHARESEACAFRTIRCGPQTKPATPSRISSTPPGETVVRRPVDGTVGVACCSKRKKDRISSLRTCLSRGGRSPVLSDSTEEKRREKKKSGMFSQRPRHS